MFSTAMNDCEDIFWQSLFSPGKRKKKKKSKQNSKNKYKSKEGTPKKKKRHFKFDEAMEENKAKKKEKKKKDKMSAKRPGKPVHEHSASKFVSKTEFAGQLTPESLTQFFNKKSKPKKQVAFDLPQDYIRVKRPKSMSSSLPSPKESTSPMTRPMGNAVATVPYQSQAKTNESESTSDDMLSQDLFITQKTFRLPLSEMSSEEASDKSEHAAKVAQGYYREIKDECLFPTQRSNTKLPNKKTKLCKEIVKCSPTNTYRDVPTTETSLPDRKKSSRKECTVLSQLSHSSQQQKSITKSSFTQTENFFSTELTLYLNFCQKRRRNADPDELKPLDLSLPNRARRDPSSCMVTKEQHEKTNQRGKVTEGSSGQPPWSTRGQTKEETSPQSESEPKSADTSTSGEDNEAPSRICSLDLMQV